MRRLCARPVRPLQILGPIVAPDLEGLTYVRVWSLECGMRNEDSTALHCATLHIPSFQFHIRGIGERLEHDSHFRAGTAPDETRGSPATHVVESTQETRSLRCPHREKAGIPEQSVVSRFRPDSLVERNVARKSRDSAFNMHCTQTLTIRP